ncbi:hypothetical protein ACFL2V_16220 [Pseudomonadota bacterium]
MTNNKNPYYLYPYLIIIFLIMNTNKQRLVDLKQAEEVAKATTQEAKLVSRIDELNTQIADVQNQVRDLLDQVVDDCRYVNSVDDALEILEKREKHSFLDEYNRTVEHLRAGTASYDEIFNLRIIPIRGIAKKLARIPGNELAFQKLISLDQEQASILASFGGDILDVYSPVMKDIEVLRALTAFRGKELTVTFPCVVDKSFAEVVAQFKGEQLAIFGLSEYDEEIARALVQFKGSRLLIPNTNISMLSDDAYNTIREFDGTCLEI